MHPNGDVRIDVLSELIMGIFRLYMFFNLSQISTGLLAFQEALRPVSEFEILTEERRGVRKSTQF